jgi:hypothetical protein
MEIIKKTICRAVTIVITGGTGSTKVVVPAGYYTKPKDVYLGWTGVTGGTGYIIVPDLTAIYNFKIGLTAELQDIGFFDAYAPVVTPAPPTPPIDETYYYEDYNGDVFEDYDGEPFVWLNY